MNRSMTRSAAEKLRQSAGEFLTQPTLREWQARYRAQQLACKGEQGPIPAPEAAQRAAEDELKTFLF